MTELKLRVELWNAIDAFARACGADTSKHVYGNTARMKAVAAVERAVDAEVRALREELSGLQIKHARYRELHRDWVKMNDTEVERLKAEVERVSGGRMRDLLTDAEELCKQRYTQLRELREAVEGLPNRWRDRRRALYLDEGDGAWDECAEDLEEALAKAGGQ